MAQSYSDLILTRDLRNTLPTPEWPTGFQGLVVRSSKDTGFSELVTFYESHGFPSGWPKQMLDNNRSAVVVMAQDNAKPQTQVVAGGWAVTERFYVDELGRSINPEPDGVYFFGDLVAENWRGRGLQRQLIRSRMLSACELGKHWAYSVTRLDNPASWKSYQHEEFVIALEMKVRLLWKIRIDRMIRPNGSLPSGKLSKVGVGLPLGFRLRRAR